MISIVIPTLNEEKNLLNLLGSLKRQNFQNFEVIVADAGSSDKTIKIAESFGCKITNGGKPAEGRNRGAFEAQGEIILFLDADVFLPDDFLEKAQREFKIRNLDISSFGLFPISEKKYTKVLFDIFYNYPLKILEKKWAHGAMAIMVKKSLHKKIGGFDKKIKIAEDHHYVQQASKLGRFGFVKKTKVFVSTRRIEKEGVIRLGLKYSYAELYMKFKGPLKKEVFQYDFDNYN